MTNKSGCKSQWVPLGVLQWKSPEILNGEEKHSINEQRTRKKLFISLYVLFLTQKQNVLCTSAKSSEYICLYSIFRSVLFLVFDTFSSNLVSQNGLNVVTRGINARQEELFYLKQCSGFTIRYSKLFFDRICGIMLVGINYLVKFTVQGTYSSRLRSKFVSSDHHNVAQR